MEEDKSLQTAELWRKFLLITEEMMKFLNQDNVDMFLTLFDQRIRLHKMIEQLQDEMYQHTEDGKAILAKVQPMNRQMRFKVQQWLNKTKRNQTMARAYDSLGYGMTGHQINREY